MTSWKLISANDADVSRRSFGTVETVQDLYSCRIFGAKESHRCECGRLTGPSQIGKFCSYCRVWVVEDADSVRKSRFGKIDLACHWHHRAAGGYLTLFPVAPIAFRIGQDGQPTRIGRKYEDLVQVNRRLMTELPPIHTQEYYDADLLTGHPDLSAVVDDLVGTFDYRGRAVLSELDKLDGSLIGLLQKAVSRLDSDLSVYAHACCLALKVTATI
jgi:hypothetical protein